MIVSVDSIEDHVEDLELIGLEIRDWTPELGVCIVAVPDDSAKEALERLSAKHGWYVEWRHDEYMSYAVGTFVDICKKVLEDGSTPD